MPARYGATRLPGKPLADIGGRAMIEHVYRRAARAAVVDSVVVATDDQRIASAVEAFGGRAVLTSAAHASGTDRVAEAARALACDIVVNVQGDEPLIHPDVIGEVAGPLLADPDLVMSTLGLPLAAEDAANPNVVKVVVGLDGRALYFSRAAIPHARDGQMPRQGVLRHVGIYAYRRPFLLTLASLPRTPLEVAESLEQLRALEHGYGIAVVRTSHDSVAVDTPEDLARVRRLAAHGWFD